jgi:hypothetical protein
VYSRNNGQIYKFLWVRKNTQVVTNLQQTCSNAVPTTCEQDVFALLVPNLLATCYKVVELNRLVISCSNNSLSSCNSTISQHVVSDNLVATWWNNNIVTTCRTSLLQACCEHILLTSCEIFTCVRNHINCLHEWWLFCRIYTQKNQIKYFFFAHVCPDGSSVKMNFARTSVWMGQAACHRVSVFV